MSTATVAARQKLHEMAEQGIKAERFNPLEKVARNPKSLRLAINAQCYDCQGRNHDPNNHLRIRECHITDCPLYPVRPYQEKGDGLDQT